MDKNYSLLQYMWQVLWLSLKTVLGIIRLLAFIATILFGYLSWRNPNWEEPIKMLTWIIPLCIFVLLLIIGAFYRSYKLYKEKANKVDELTKKAVELVVGNNDQYFRYRNDRIVMVGRIGIKSLGRSIKNVGVTLVAIDNNENSYIDSFLNPAECQLSQPPTFGINPSDVPKFIEVFTWNTKIDSDAIGICYYTNYHYVEQHGGNPASNPSMIISRIEFKDRRIHVLTIQATGEDIQPVKENFIVERTDKGIEWRKEIKNS